MSIYALFFLSGAWASEPLPLSLQALGADEPSSLEPGFFGDARLRADALSDPVLDDIGTVSDRGPWLTSRLRLGGRYEAERGAGALEFELLSGRVLGGTDVGQGYLLDGVFAVDRSGGPGDLLGALPRQAWVGIQGPAGLARVGTQTFTWGTGMLANDGAGDPVFGDAVRGSVMNRVLGAWTPWRADEGAGWLRGVGVLGAFDVVLRDDNAALLDGDLAVQGVVGIRSEAPRWQLGALSVLRWQRDRLDPYHPTGHPTTLAWPLGGHARVQLTDPTANQTLGIEAEVVGITGRTERPWSDETVAQGARIRSLGAVGRLRWDHNAAGVTALLEGGAASGDNDSRDGVVRTFTMHSDHNVGLVLFEELLPLLTANALDRVADPALSAVPAAGGRFAVAQGGVHNALYLYPTSRVRVAQGVELRVGGMSAWSAGDLVDLYNTALSGGYNTTYGGQSPGDRHLGVEGLLGTVVRIPVGSTSLDSRVEAAVFAPGAAFDGMDLQTLATVRAGVDWRW